MRDRTLLAGALCAFLFALGLRLGPLYWSPLPFNPDGIKYAALSRDVLATDALPLGDMATDEVGFTSLIAVVATLSGDSPLRAAQPVSAIVGASSVLVGVVLARRLAMALDWSARDAGCTGLLTGLLLGLEGVYLYRTMPSDEQTVAFLLVPVFVLAVEQWYRTEDAAWALVVAGTLAVIPPLHNLSGIVAVLAVVVLTALSIVRRPSLPTLARGSGLVLVASAYVFGYHASVDRFTPARIVQAERLLAVPDLLVAWAIVAAVGAAWFVTSRARAQRVAVVGTVALAFGLVALNAVRPVFPATTPTARPLLLLLSPFLVLALLAGIASHAPAVDRRVGRTVIALVAAPIVVAGTALTAALTFDYLAMLFRAHLFAHVPLLVLAGLGTVGFARKSSGGVRFATVVCVVLVTAMTTPIAYAGLGLLPYESVTTEAEFAASETAAGSGVGWATDDHLVRVGRYHDGDSAAVEPVYRWAAGSGSPPDCPVLAQRSWTTTGAQFYPRSPVSLSETEYREWLAGGNVVSVTLSEDPLTLAIPRSNGGSC